MAEIGKPQIANNNYANIKMQNSVLSKEEQINKIAGNKTSRKFVDRQRHTQLEGDDFMKLLTHQLTLQDPTDPMDQKKFAAELAQFSQLEQLRGMNQKMEQIMGNNPSQNKYFGASFLGKQAITAGTSVNYKGQDIEIPFSLPKNASKAVLRIYDEKNQISKQVDFEKLAQGSQFFMWDGTQSDGTKVKEGKYRVEVIAWDETLAKFEGETKVSGLVTGVGFQNGDTILEIEGNKRIFLHDVESFKLVEDNKNNLKAENNPSLKSDAIKAYTENQELGQ